MNKILHLLSIILSFHTLVTLLMSWVSWIYLKNYTFLQRKTIFQSALEAHADAHKGLKRFECNICYKRFTHRAGLIRHMKLHSEDDPFSCEFCGKKFRDRTEQENHRRAHTGERPYMCDICGRTFHTRAVWLDHSR